ncbi:MAG: hypothetical protein AB7G44_02830 [Bacteroidia bacterium]
MSLTEIISFIYSIRHFILLNIFCLIFLILYFLAEFYFGNLYDFVFFYFDASYRDFVLWFPQYHLLVFTIVLTIKAFFLVSLIISGYFLIKKSITSNAWFMYNKGKGYTGFITFELIVVLLILFYYLVVYFFSVNFFSPVQHEKYQILIAKCFLFHISIQLVISLAGNHIKIKRYIKSYLFFPQLPYNIAILRVLFFLYLVFIYLGKYLSILPTVSLKTKKALPYLGWLIDIVPVNVTLYTGFVFTGIFCCLFIILGYKTKWFLLLNTVCCFYIMATPNFFGKLWHEQLVIWISWFFTFSKCYDVFSIDSILNNTPIVKSADYTFPVRFVWLQFGIIYFWAGFYKLWDCGFDWALSKSMVNQVQIEWLQNYDKIPGIRIDKYPLILYAGGLAAILFELGYILFVLKPAIRWVAAVGGIVMHNIIGYFMYISFFFLLQAFYVFYVDFNKFFKQKNCKTETILNYSKTAFYSGIFILSANFIFGMFSIDTYPFSAYPKYAALVPDKIKIIHFEAELSDANKIDVHNVGKKNNFRWESYGWLEHNLIRDFENGDDISSGLNDYWKIWVNHNPELKECITVNAYIIERSVEPEGKNNIKVIKKLDYYIE